MGMRVLAVPFEEDDKDPSIWFLDHSYLENMFRMFKKVNGTSSKLLSKQELTRVLSLSCFPLLYFDGLFALQFPLCSSRKDHWMVPHGPSTARSRSFHPRPDGSVLRQPYSRHL